MRFLLIPLLFISSIGFGQAIDYVPTRAAAYISSSGTGLAGSWSPFMAAGDNPVDYVPTRAALYVSNDGTGNAGTWVPWTGESGGGGAVDSVFGRTGDVVATSGDYSFSLISGRIAPSTQLPNTSFVWPGGTGLTVDPVNGIIDALDFVGAFTGDGSAVTGLNAANISSGTVNTARLPATYALGTPMVIGTTVASNFTIQTNNIARWIVAGANPGGIIPATNGTQAIGDATHSVSAIYTNQIVSAGTAPTIANGAGAGTTPGTPTISGTNISGVVTVVTGTATPTASTIATITFNGTLPSAPRSCHLQSMNDAATLNNGVTFTTAPSTTSWTIASGSIAVAASTTLTWGYFCI